MKNPLLCLMKVGHFVGHHSLNFSYLHSLIYMYAELPKLQNDRSLPRERKMQTTAPQRGSSAYKGLVFIEGLSQGVSKK